MGPGDFIAGGIDEALVAFIGDFIFIDIEGWQIDPAHGERVVTTLIMAHDELSGGNEDDFSLVRRAAGGGGLVCPLQRYWPGRAAPSTGTSSTAQHRPNDQYAFPGDKRPGAVTTASRACPDPISTYDACSPSSARKLYP